MTESQQVPAAAPAQAISPFAAIGGTFANPGETFGRLVKAPTWWLPFLLWVATGLLVTWAVTPKIDMERTLRETMERRGQQVTEQQIKQQTQVMEKMPWIIPVSAGVMSVVMFFAAGLVLWGAAKAFGAEAGFGQLLAVWSHSTLPNVVGGLLALPLFLTQADGSMTQQAAQRFVKSNPAAFLPAETSPVIASIAGSLDVFALATLALLVVGFRKLPGLSRGSATAIPIALWVLYVVVKTGWVAVFG